MIQLLPNTHFLIAFCSVWSYHFSSKSTSMIWDLGGFLELPLLLLLLLLLLPSLEKKSPCGCHTMFLHPSHLITWFLYPMNCLLHAGHSPCASPNIIITELSTAFGLRHIITKSKNVDKKGLSINLDDEVIGHCTNEKRTSDRKNPCGDDYHSEQPSRESKPKKENSLEKWNQIKSKIRIINSVMIIQWKSIYNQTSQ